MREAIRPARPFYFGAAAPDPVCEHQHDRYICLVKICLLLKKKILVRAKQGSVAHDTHVSQSNAQPNERGGRKRVSRVYCLARCSLHAHGTRNPKRKTGTRKPRAVS